MKNNNSEQRPRQRRSLWAVIKVGALGSVLLMACSPTVKVEAPDKPIEINLNIKIEQDVRVRMDKDVDELIADNPDIF